MRKFLMSSILAALAACRPGKPLTGKYAQKAETNAVVLKDTLIVSQGAHPDSVNIERRAAFRNKDGTLPKDTTVVTNMKGRYDPKEKQIKMEDSSIIRVKPKRRELQRAQWNYRRIGR